jgi:RHS repeat-associated protein
MTSESDPLGYTIQLTYNQFSEPLTFVNQEGYTTSYEYDANGNLLEQTNPDGTTQQYAYNSLGEATSSTDPDGQTITYAYNTNGQLTTENLPGGTSNTYAYDSHGNILTADGPGGDWSFNYNSQNLPTTIVEPYGTLTVQYGIDGNVTQIVDQTGFTVNYVYDAVGRLSKLTDGSGDLIESYTYDPAGNVISETKGNGTSTTYQYNADGDITGISNLAPNGSINSQMTYAYNAVGEVTAMTTGGVTTAYGYDADGELTSASSPGDTIQYAYDPDGNRTSVTDNGVVTNYVSNDANEYTSTTTNGVTTTYEYDANGNLIAATTGGQTTTYTFNALNQLTGVSGPNGTFSYTYDPLGYQISSTVNGQTTNNLIDPFGLGNVAAQFGSSGNLAAHYTYGFGLASQVSASGSAYYYDFNLQGSTVGITNSAGVYVNQYSYDPFGQVTTISAGIANPFTFVGHYGVWVDGSGLVDMRARYYDASTGQFVSRDPTGLRGGDANPRRYAANNPVNRVDPDGEGEFGNEVGLILGGIFEQVTGIPLPVAGEVGSMIQDFVDGMNSNSEMATAVAQAEQQAATAEAAQLELSEAQLLSDSLNALGEAEGLADLELFEGLGAAAAADVLWPVALGLGAGFLLGNWLNQLLQPPEPPGPPPGPCPGCSSDNRTPTDPNDLIGPSGSAEFIAPGGALPYTIEFSNEKTAQVPADNVTVTEQLSPNLDWSTFQLGTIGFGNYVVTVPAGLTSYSMRVDATATLGVYVDVDASLNLTTGLLTVTFTSLDPDTLDTPSNPLVGFLPPDTNPPNGEGYINYTVQPKAGLATGATINAQASIVFDTNAPLATPEITNTIDASPPMSTVAALPATTTKTSFTVSWSGNDGAGPGIAGYNVYVSDNGGVYTLWQSDTTNTSATYTGKTGHVYRFYSVATDDLGLVQPTPASPQATTKVVLTQPSPPIVTVTYVQDLLNKKHQATAVVVIFSGAVNAAEADRTSTYRLATPGKGGSYTAKNAGLIKLKSASYNAVSDTVILTPAKPFTLNKPVQLVVYASGPNGLQDTHGRFINNGKNVVVLPTPGPVIHVAQSAGTDTQIVPTPAAIDALLERDHLADLRHRLGAPREQRPILI